jgi:hypothetical protein
MIRKLLTVVLPLVLPLLLYFGYAYLAQRRAGANGTAAPPWHKGPWPILLLAGAGLMFAALALWRASEGIDPGTEIVPPSYVDGEIRPGHAVE